MYNLIGIYKSKTSNKEIDIFRSKSQHKVLFKNFKGIDQPLSIESIINNRYILTGRVIELIIFPEKNSIKVNIFEDEIFVKDL